MRTVSPDAEIENADWTKTLTQYALGDPPMIGWWETIIAERSLDLAPDAEAPSFRRWWGGPVSGWSIAVTPYYQGLELYRVAEMPWRPSNENSVIWYRGLRKPKALQAYRYPLNSTSLSPADVRRANKYFVRFDMPAPVVHSSQATGKPRTRVEVEQMPLPLTKARVVIRGEMPRYGAPAHDQVQTYGMPKTKQRVRVMA